MLKNNNKGYLLAETIIAITVVATAITTIYKIIMNNYIIQSNDITKFNTPSRLYIANDVKNYFSDKLDSYNEKISENGYLNVTNENKDFLEKLNIKNLYYLTYNIPDNFFDNESIPNSIKKDLKKSKSDKEKCIYRYIIIFEDDGYSTIGINCYE